MYNFTRLSDKKLVPLDEIDAIICRELGEKPDDTRFSTAFDVITDIGTYACGDGKWSSDKFLEVAMAETLAFAKLALRMLHTEYRFSCYACNGGRRGGTETE